MLCLHDRAHNKHNLVKKAAVTRSYECANVYGGSGCYSLIIGIKENDSATQYIEEERKK